MPYSHSNNEWQDGNRPPGHRKSSGLKGTHGPPPTRSPDSHGATCVWSRHRHQRIPPETRLQKACEPQHVPARTTTPQPPPGPAALAGRSHPAPTGTGRPGSAFTPDRHGPSWFYGDASSAVDMPLVGRHHFHTPRHCPDWEGCGPAGGRPCGLCGHPDRALSPRPRPTPAPHAAEGWRLREPPGGSPASTFQPLHLCLPLKT